MRHVDNTPSQILASQRVACGGGEEEEEKEEEEKEETRTHCRLFHLAYEQDTSASPKEGPVQRHANTYD
ncbi:hypothetical protein CSOJ01_03590 [Colletotrichum sojae]|uniref:Uncharacterized protein n=1 Tax=Colletotrichum sojae TaxID=2175907 RepID=A0A8H6N020_9PEZI|nr:hypothetical protein CSOJ01_03590 [Colletotrichum sojae]